jgi:protein dithiol oxidoreductase (disulfide-forming)
MIRAQSPARRHLVARIAAVLAAGLFAAVPAFAQLAEGKGYIRLAKPVPVESGRKIEVIEFFSYGCPHCADLEPILQRWLANLPPDVQFRRIPVAFQPAWENLARSYYTLDALGEDKLSPAVFAAIHRSGARLDDPKAFFDWAATRGLDRKKVEDMYNSFTMAARLSKAKQTAQAYNVQSVPTLVVDGKFVTASDKIGGHANVPAALDALIAKARAERPKS